MMRLPLSDEQIARLTYPEIVDLIKTLADELQLRAMAVADTKTDELNPTSRRL